MQGRRRTQPVRKQEGQQMNRSLQDGLIRSESVFVIEKILLNVEAIERQEEQCNEMVPHILRMRRIDGDIKDIFNLTAI